jgi:hypothetical protein
LREWLKRIGTHALAVAVGLAVGYFLGMRGVPDKVTEHVRTAAAVQVETRQATQAATQVDTQAVRQRATRARTRTERKPDGTVITVRTVATADRIDTRAQLEHSERADLQSAKVQRFTSETLTVRESRRDWRVSLLVGAELAIAADPIGDVAYGLHAERRIIGPVWGGAWALGVGPARSWFAGLSVGVEF